MDKVVPVVEVHLQVESGAKRRWAPRRPLRVALTSSLVHLSPTLITRSITDTLGVGTRKANAVEPALELGQHLGHNFRCPRGYEDDVTSDGACPAEVAAPTVQDHLVTRVGVCHRHQAVLHVEGVAQDLVDRGHAVRGILSRSLIPDLYKQPSIDHLIPDL